MQQIARWRVMGLLVVLLPVLSSCVSLLPEVPSVRLEVTPTLGVAPLGVRFEADVVATQAPSERGWTALWAFGDGAQAEGLKVSHRYAEPGTYRVTLTVSDGEDWTTQRSFTVTALAAPRFELRRVPTGLTPMAVAVTDLNLDHAKDVISANAEGHNISVFLSQDGELALNRFAYAAIKAPSPAPQPQWMAVGDFNNDRLPDLLTINPPDDNISLLFGNGLGGFAAPSGYTLPRPSQALIGDFDRDGNQDLIVLGQALSKGQLWLMRGRGTGEMAYGQVVLEQTWITDLISGDFDRDGDLDLALTTKGFGVEVLVLLNEGDARFAEPLALTLPQKANALTALDFDRDGVLDLVTANVDGTVSLLRGDGAGGFTLSAELDTELVGLFNLEGADLNADGHDDLLLQYRRGGQPDLALMLGDGQGRFAAPVALDGLTGSLFPVVADLNGDGVPDLALAHPEADEVVLALNLAQP